ncbi:type II 3-dehydroquinate dehydratase [Schinkia azotoformans]|uniref:type II 3-dehydroquinate dehydratase n=1 Tax=Schinkia azotoformans TaxID=1454 RepID=UPI002DBA13DC|nr:type II 3-dehydroquinate dehydratase [Schinkia azotoformans]MEC1719444.1 type II 3-dehydroquinate dehydratase [Schinkia azotoformans]MED4415582.1 type II 3-dehydroquinate dehydratase [Schinkia azotoformans]
MSKLLLINGPNLNLLGTREPDIYGNTTLKDVEDQITKFANENGMELSTFQSNHEGQIIDAIHDSRMKYAGIIFNPGAFTHYSYAIRDAIASVDVPVIEVHISNVHKREEFRHTSVLAPVCEGQIVGLGITGYKLAVIAFKERLSL